MKQLIKVNLLIRILVGIVVLIVMCSENGQSKRNQIDINLIVGVGLIAWLESYNSIRIIGLTGEYGQLIIKYGIVAIILSVLALVVMDREKKGMERVGLIVLATWGMIILVGAENLLAVYLAMEAQNLAFYTLAGLLGVIAVSSLTGWAVIPFGTGAVLADINIGILYLFAISSLGVDSFLGELVSGFHTEYSAVLFFLFVMIELVSYSARAISLGVSLAANISAGHLLLPCYSFSSAIHSQFYP